VELVPRAGIGPITGPLVMAGVAGVVVLALVLAIRAPSEQMMNWADVPSPLRRWVGRSSGGLP
jgi:hypothetical protein